MKAAHLLLAALLAIPAALPAAVTLRSLGARGDGQTDDRGAIERALTSQAGQEIDGEGLMYAVNGTISVRVDVHLKNLTLKQTGGSFDTSRFICSTGNPRAPEVKPPEALTRMVNGLPWLRHDGFASYPEDPAVTGADLEALREMLNRRTLFIRGTEQKRVSVRLENVKILRGDHPDGGMHSNSAGLYLVLAGPLTLNGVDISGDGKGSGLLIDQCRQVKLDRVQLHDLHWAPYQGDVNFNAEVLSSFGWNNSPIYDFIGPGGRFVRVRIQEQLTGLTLTRSEDVEITGCRIERVGTQVEGKFVPWQADGMTVSAVKNLVMRDCFVAQTWEGIDFTGRGVDGFVQERIRITDSFAYGFKYAHPQKNGRVIDCISERAGFKGFIIGAESENIAFVNCIARETGVESHWKRPGRPQNGIAGFDVSFEQTQAPRNITLENCRAQNIQFPNEMEYGFATSDRAKDPAHGIRLISAKVSGAKLKAISGFREE